jgi:hypothetical protein
MVRCDLRPGSRWHLALRPGSRRRRALRPGTKQRCAPDLGLRMVGGGGMTVSSATEERERVQGQKLLSMARESAGPKILGRGT